MGPSRAPALDPPGAWGQAFCPLWGTAARHRRAPSAGMQVAQAPTCPRCPDSQALLLWGGHSGTRPPWLSALGFSGTLRGSSWAGP